MFVPTLYWLSYSIARTDKIYILIHPNFGSIKDLAHCCIQGEIGGWEGSTQFSHFWIKILKVFYFDQLYKIRNILLVPHIKYPAP